MSRILSIILFLLVAVTYKCYSSNLDNAGTEKTPLELFYGMSDWYDDKETYHDSVFDNIGGIRHQEFFADLCIPQDGVRYRNSLGVYIDEEYPTKALQEKVFATLDSILCQALSYDLEEEILSHDLSSIENTDDFLNIWKVFYDNLGNVDKIKLQYPEIPGSRVCVVSHKVAEKDDYVTYMMELSVDYHGSNGCPSSADYITYNATSGKPLSINEVIDMYPITDLKGKIRDAYVNAAKERDYEPSENLTGEILLQEADGAAIINEGLLIYYKPYNIGCGAEGQYNLVIN